MRKKIIAFASVVVAVGAMITVMTAFASKPAQAEAASQPIAVAAAPVVQSLPVTQTAYTAPNSALVQDGGFDAFAAMFDEDGQPVSKEVLEANLEKAVEDGYINAEDVAVIIEMFDYCISGGMGAGSAGMPCGPGMGGAGFSGCPLSGGW